MVGSENRNFTQGLCPVGYMQGLRWAGTLQNSPERRSGTFDYCSGTQLIRRESAK